MMIRLALIFFIIPLLAATSITSASADDHVLNVDLAQDNVEVTTGFSGTDLALYGVKNKNGDVAVILHGPQKDMVVRRKARVMGAWLNRSSLKFEDIPQFYDMALSKPAQDLLPPQILKEQRIGPKALRFEPARKNITPDKKRTFQDALIRNKQNDGLFPKQAKNITHISDTFFKVLLHMPSNVPTGQYVIETFLIENQKIIDKRVTNIRVENVGFSAAVAEFAHSYAFLYAITVLFAAVLAGWLSNAVRKTK